MYPLRLSSSVCFSLLLCSLAAHAQSNVGELITKGGKLLDKNEVLALLPARIQQEWPNRQGEEELVLSLDGKISGKGLHYASRSESPATGTWQVEDDGKVCTPKTFTAWNNTTRLCWYVFQLEQTYYGSLKTEATSPLNKINSLVKIAGATQ